jgi:hypothetical protein
VRWWPPAPRVVETTELWCVVRPNPSFDRARYCTHRRPGLRHMAYHLSPGVRCLLPRAGQLER